MVDYWNKLSSRLKSNPKLRFNYIMGKISALETSIGNWVDKDTVYDDTALSARISVLEGYFTRNLSFTIKDSQDTPEAIQGAVVSINGKTGTTTAEGTCTINGILDGTYEVTVEAEGYETVTASKLVDSTHTSFTISLTAVTPEEEVSG